MPDSTSFTWLHLTDLHVGMDSGPHPVERLTEELPGDLAVLRETLRFERIDAIFFTGDLVYSGTREQYDGVNELLGSLRRRIASRLGCDPPLLAIPGNHDLAWMELTRDERALRRSFHDPDPHGHVRAQFFERRAGGSDYWLRERVCRAFAEYEAWSAREETRLHERTPGLLPGDFASTIETADGLKVGVLGLNTAFLDIASGHSNRAKAGQLGLFKQQVTRLVDDFGGFCDEHNICFLLTHHPPSWLHPGSINAFGKNYLLRDKIALHLCGHLHDVASTRWSTGDGPEGWSDMSLAYQGRSFFGREFQSAGADEEVSCGYALGRIEFPAKADAVDVRVYPRAWSGGTFDRDRETRSLDKRGGALPLPERPPVRPWPMAQMVRESPLLVGPTDALDAVSRHLWKPMRTGYQPGMYLSAPAGYGKTELLDDRVEARWKAQPRSRECFVRASFQERALQWEGVRSHLRTQIQDATGVNLPHEGDFKEFVKAVLDARTAASGLPARLALVLERPEALLPDLRGNLEDQLRATLDELKWVGDAGGGVRILIVSRAPWECVLLNRKGSLARALFSDLPLVPVSPDALVKWAGHPWEDRRALCDWLCDHTGGHPAFLTSFVSEIEQAIDRHHGQLPRVLSDAQGPEGWRNQFSTAKGILRQRTRQLEAFIWEKLRDYSLAGVARRLDSDTGPDELEWRGRMVSTRDLKEACGLYQPGGERLIPFVEDVLAHSSFAPGQP